MAGDPARFQFSDWQARRERAVPSFLVSLAIHAAVATVAWNVNPRPEGRVFRAPTITQILTEENRQVVWYSPKAEMPKVAPARRQDSVAERPPRFEAPQPISANAPDAASDRQTIVGDAPEIRIEQDQTLPNMLSWTAPKVEMPRYQLLAPPRPKPPEAVKIEPEEAPRLDIDVAPAVDVSRLSQIARLRYEARRNEAAPPSGVKIEAEPAPEIRAETAPPIDPAQLTGIARLRYQQQQGQREAPRPRALSADDAPALHEVPGQPGLDASQFQQIARLRYRAGDQGSAAPAPARQALGALAEAPAPEIAAVPAAPAVALPAGTADVPRLRYQGREQMSAAVAPSARALGEVAGQAAPEVGGPGGQTPSLAAELPSVALPAPPSSLGADGAAAGGTGGERNLAVVGVKPADRVPDELPRGSRAGAFAAGPNATADGGPGAPKGDPSAALRLPDLAIDAPSPDDPAEAVRRLTRGGGFEQMRPQARREIGVGPAPLKIDPDLPFAGRAVYTLAINMPNVTSYRGDWVLQFAEALPPGARAGETPEEREKRLSQRDDSLTPPYPSVKVDPKYSAEAVRERIEGEVVLYAIIRETGELTNLTLVKGVDPRLDASAREAISKWRFEPARKLGAPIAVEALVRIPFRVNPGARVRY